MWILDKTTSHKLALIFSRASCSVFSLRQRSASVRRSQVKGGFRETGSDPKRARSEGGRRGGGGALQPRKRGQTETEREGMLCGRYRLIGRSLQVAGPNCSFLTAIVPHKMWCQVSHILSRNFFCFCFRHNFGVIWNHVRLIGGCISSLIIS